MANVFPPFTLKQGGKRQSTKYKDRNSFNALNEDGNIFLGKQKKKQFFFHIVVVNIVYHICTVKCTKISPCHWLVTCSLIHKHFEACLFIYNIERTLKQQHIYK